VLRLGANESPHGPFPGARAAAVQALERLQHYPAPEAALAARLAARDGLTPEHYAFGNGGDGVIGYVSVARLSAGAQVVTGWPSFPTYVGDAEKLGAVPVLVPLRSDGAVDLEAMLAAITPQTALVWVCSPNNPTGASVGRNALTAFLDAVPPSVLVVVDEAYYEFAAGPGHVDAIAEHVAAGRPNVGVLRTFSKLYGLAGLRIGYFAGPPAVAAELRAARHYYDVIDVAVAAALASLDDGAEVARRREVNRRDRARLEAGLDALGLERLPSDANFVAVRVPDAARAAARLADAGILVRSLEDLGEPGLLRITVGAPDAVDAVLAALPAALA
jgi:histidinol-phosphate aminotransferase